MNAFTYKFGKDYGESETASITAKILGLNHCISTLDSNEIPFYLKKVLFFQESPVTSIRVLAHHKMYEDVKKNDFKVILEGSGGDEIAAGYEYYYSPYILDFLKKNSIQSAFEELNLYMQKFKVSKELRFQRFLDTIKTTFQPGVSTQDGVSFTNHNCINKDYFESIEEPKFEDKFEDWLRKTQWKDFNHVVLPKALRYCDRASMSSSCESRVPILDHRIVELGFNCSTDAKMLNGEQRIFMKYAAKNILPKSILNKPKKTIVDPQRKWLKDELSDWVLDLFNSNTSKKLGFLNSKEIIKEFERYKKQKSPRTSAHIFQFVNIINWYNVFFENGYEQ